MNSARVHPSAPPPRFNVLGSAISALSLDEATRLVLSARDKKKLGHICCATAYNTNLALADPALRTAYNTSFLTTPDGMPLVWLGRWHGHKTITRVYGPDLLLAACDAGRAVGLKHFFYGGDVGVAAQLKAQLQTRFPGADIVGTYTPPFRALDATEIAELHAQVAAAAPDVIWIGLSTPKQEKFMLQFGPTLDAKLLIGVGAAFDFHSGRVTQAPRWMQRNGLEWLHRLATDPARLWQRYLVHNPLFVLRTLAQLSGLRRYPLSDR